jgi:hypothetical protein
MNGVKTAAKMLSKNTNMCENLTISFLNNLKYEQNFGKLPKQKSFEI